MILTIVLIYSTITVFVGVIALINWYEYKKMNSVLTGSYKLEIKKAAQRFFSAPGWPVIFVIFAGKTMRQLFSDATNNEQ